MYFSKADLQNKKQVCLLGENCEIDPLCIFLKRICKKNSVYWGNKIAKSISVYFSKNAPGGSFSFLLLPWKTETGNPTYEFGRGGLNLVVINLGCTGCTLRKGRASA